MGHRYDVYGIGNAIVDTEVQVEDLLLAAHGLRKGIMTLVSMDAQQELLHGLEGYARHAAAGGSAANTMVGVAQFGGRAFFTGKVGSDMSGALYRESMAEAGVELDVEGHDSMPTGTCLVLVSADGERTMQTSLGASALLTKNDIEEDRLTESQVLYVEGYLFGAESPAEAALHAMETAKAAGVRVALTLSDPGLAEHCIDQFRRATREYVDVLFCNEHEARIYTGGRNDGREVVLRALAADCPMVFMTCGADGSMVLDNGAILEVPGYKVPVVDTTGAGDVYAAGALYGITNGRSLTQAAQLGSFASAKIITSLGPRLKEPLAGQIDAILDGAQPAD
ncbi:MAG: adenosine kinase [Dehalococcoidia bacterium]